MALVSGGRSTLNPNAPLYIPTSMRQVEDFSPEWWQLVTTSTWFHGYWLSQQGDDFLGYEEDSFGEADVVDLLPDSIDLGLDEEDLYMEAQFEEFLRSSETGQEYMPCFSIDNELVSRVLSEIRNLLMEKKGQKYAAEQANFAELVSRSVIKSLNLPLEKGQKYAAEQAKFAEKPAKYISPKCSPRRIQQPR